MTVVHASHRSQLALPLVVAAGGLITALSLGVRSTFGLLIGPISEGVGADLGSISLAVAIQNLMWGFSQPLAGALSDRFGAPSTLAGGGVLYIAAMALMSTAESAGMVIFSGGFLAGIAVGAASFAVVLSAVGRISPPEKRSINLGIVSAVGSLGQFVLIPVARFLLDRGDWQSTSMMMAVVLVPILLVAPALRSTLIEHDAPAAPALASKPARTLASKPAPALRDDLRRARASRPYLLLNAAFFVCGFHVTFIGVHLAGFVELSGLSASTASTGLALIGLFNVFGSLLVGVLGQRFSYTKLLAAIYGMRAVTIAIYVVVPVTSASTIAFAMAMGVLWLSTVPPTSAIVTDMFGPANSGALFGIVFLSHQLGSFIGAWMGGEVVDVTGSYLLVWWIAVALGIFAMVMHLLLEEGPAPDVPGSGSSSTGRGFGLATGAAALFVATAAVAGALSSHVDEPIAFYCALGPVVGP